MSEEQDSGVETVVAAQNEPEHSQAEVAPKPSDQDRNWKQAREQLEELKRHNQRLEAETQKLKQQMTAPAVEEDISYADEDLSTVGVTKKLIRKEAQKIAAELLQKKEAEDAEKWARIKFSDYDAVVSNDNLQRLVQTAPEVAKMLMNNPDPVAAYKLLKTMGIDAGETAQLRENQQKPRSMQSVGQASALSQANAFAKGLTPELKTQLWNEMKQAAKASS